MNERLKRIADFFSTSELIELIDVNSVDLVDILDDAGLLDEDTLTDIEEIMGIEDDE